MDDLPQPVPGQTLAGRRRHVGVAQGDLAEALGITRVTLHNWEKDPSLDPIRAHRYEQALQAILAKALGRSA